MPNDKKTDLNEAWAYALQTYEPVMLEAILKVAIANRDSPKRLAKRLHNIHREYEEKLRDNPASNLQDGK